MNNELNIALIPQEEWKEVYKELKEVKMLLKKRNEDEINSQWIESTEARKLLNVSQKTWQSYRDQRRIPFSQFGRKIYVKRGDLEKFMESNLINSLEGGK